MEPHHLQRRGIRLARRSIRDPQVNVGPRIYSEGRVHCAYEAIVVSSQARSSQQRDKVKGRERLLELTSQDNQSPSHFSVH